MATVTIGVLREHLRVLARGVTDAVFESSANVGTPTLSVWGGLVSAVTAAPAAQTLPGRCQTSDTRAMTQTRGSLRLCRCGASICDFAC